MLLLKSKWFWICTGLSICIVIFLAVVIHRANQRQAVIKVYKAVDPAPPVTPLSPGDTPVSDTHTQTNTPGIYTRDKTSNKGVSDNFSEGTTSSTDVPTDNDFSADEHRSLEAGAVEVDDFYTDAATASEASYATQRLAELRIEIPQRLQERLDLLELVEELAPSNGGPPELSPLRDKLDEEAVQLRRTIFELGNDYIMYSEGDFSPFQPGGEFYELLQLNHMGFKKAVE